MQGNQQRYGYMVMFPEFESADLSGGLYTRWSANGGYVLNKLILNNFELGATVGLGVIHRKGSIFSLGAGFTLAYEINRIKFVYLYQITDRTDIGKIRNSGFIGAEIELN